MISNRVSEFCNLLSLQTALSFLSNFGTPVFSG